jgi:hypothetical protein
LKSSVPICWAFRTPSVCSVWESSVLAKYFSHTWHCTEEYY